jgi:MarR family transcriptional regulator, transcriptional regulator for hemolysin
MRPKQDPIGLEVSRTGRLLHRAFDAELAAAGGSLPVWLIITALKRSDHTMQRDLAATIGIEDATLTHHLNRMERSGLVVRQRDPDNRRNQTATLTDDGEALFATLLTAVLAFDRQVRAGFTAADLDVLRGLLGRLRANVSSAALGD